MLPSANRRYSLLMLGLSGTMLAALAVAAILLMLRILPILPGAIIVFILFSWCSYGYPVQKRLVLAVLSRRRMKVHDLS